MPDDRASSEAARRKKAAERQGKQPATARPAPAKTKPADSAALPPREPRALWLKIVGWVAYAIAFALFVVFVVLWVHNQIPRSQQLYPLPGLSAGFLIVGIWASLGPWLYRSRSTATRAGKYVLAIVLTVVFYPLVVTLVDSLAQWIVSLFPGSPLH